MKEKAITLFKAEKYSTSQSTRNAYHSVSYLRNESGRSLTEMMGTLAIMGILAIAGIWMYNTAMDKLKANTIINEAQKRAVVVAGQIGFQGRTNPSLGEFSDNTFSGGTFSTDVVVNGLYQQFGIQVSGVSKNVCQNILNSIGEETPIRRLAYVGSPTHAIGACTDNNTFLLIYNNDISNDESDVEYTNSECGCQTVCGQCIVENNVSKCVGECPVNQENCSSNADCQGVCVGCIKESGQTTGKCQACQPVEYLESTGTQYINTGITSQNTRTDIDFAFTSLKNEQAIMGVWQYNPVLIYQVALYQQKWYFGSNMGAESNVSWKEGTPNTERHTITLDGKGGLYQDGSLLKTGTVSTVAGRSPILIFGRYTEKSNSIQNTTTSSMRCYGITIQQADSLVREFIPVHAPFKETGKQNCLFDRVSGELFCNAATGDDFIIP